MGKNIYIIVRYKLLITLADGFMHDSYTIVSVFSSSAIVDACSSSSPSSAATASSISFSVDDTAEGGFPDVVGWFPEFDDDSSVGLL